MLSPPQATTIDKGHGRIEKRSIWTSTELADYLTFPHVAQVFCLERITTHLPKGKVTEDTVFGVTSLTPEMAGPDRLLQLVREHWSIENRLHWVRDVTYDEDRSQVRIGNGAQTMATLRNIAISILRMAGARLLPPAQRCCARLGLGVLRLIGIQIQL